MESAGTTRGEQAERLARAAVDWMVDGPVIDLDDSSLYHGLSGVVLALEEAHRHFGDGRYGDGAAQGADVLTDAVGRLEDCSLYFGLAGVAVALHALGRDAAADRALVRIRQRFDGQRWNEMFELLMGNAGIGLGALYAGDTDLAVSAAVVGCAPVGRAPPDSRPATSPAWSGGRRASRAARARVSPRGHPACRRRRRTPRPRW